jgi:hypothetical protein
MDVSFSHGTPTRTQANGIIVQFQSLGTSSTRAQFGTKLEYDPPAIFSSYPTNALRLQQRPRQAAEKLRGSANARPGVGGSVSSGSAIRRRKFLETTAAIALAALAFACTGPPPVSMPPTTPTLNTSLQPIDVRYGIHARDIELAILLAIAAPEGTPALDPGQKISDALLTKIIGGPTGVRRAGNPWTYASRKPGLVFAEYEHEGVWMRVAVKYDTQMVLLRIVESRGLGQSGDRIHARALDYLGELDRRIRQTVIMVAQRNSYGTPVPARLF